MIEHLHPELRIHGGTLLEIIGYAKEVEGDLEMVRAAVDTDPAWQSAMAWASSYIERRWTTQGGSAFSFPLLDPAYCQELIQIAENMGDFAPNPAECLDYQIPEIVLAHRAPELYEHLKGIGAFIMMWSALVFLKMPGRVSSIQFAKYEPDGTAHGNWHFDSDSDFSAVVSLDPTRFTGGGTDIRNGLDDYLTVPPLPPGHILFFDGRKLMHRGRAVESGVRHLLVFWLME